MAITQNPLLSNAERSDPNFQRIERIRDYAEQLIVDWQVDYLIDLDYADGDGNRKHSHTRRDIRNRLTRLQTKMTKSEIDIATLLAENSWDDSDGMAATAVRTIRVWQQ